MDVRAKPSANFEDRTGWTPHQEGMHAVAVALNPVYAYRSVKSALIDKGVIDPGPLRLGLPKSGAR